jgi:hypothetical protein
LDPEKQLTAVVAQYTVPCEHKHEQQPNETPSSPSLPGQLISVQSRLPKNKEPKITQDDISNGSVLASNTSRKVVKIGGDIIVKFGPRVDLAKAEALLFVRENTSIPVPKILDTYSQDGKNYIIMTYIPGVMLQEVWESMSVEDKSVVTKELKEYVCQMRRLPAPRRTFIGSVTSGPAVDRRQFGSALGGPFHSEAEFN